jgi:hypothetical protein
VKFKRKQLEDKMGLDMYAYVGRTGQRDEFYETADWDEKTNELVGPVSKPVEIAYWRKHPSLHGWMEKLWLRKNGFPSTGDQQFIEGRQAPSFNGIELELSWEDIDELEHTVRHGKLPFTEGFFFGKPADNVYYEEDLKFCVDAKAELFLGFKVFYNSSW